MKFVKPDREGTSDIEQGFRNPPACYGIVPFFWWVGDPLTKERLSFELEKLSGHDLCGLQINYAHSAKGGRAYGLTYPSDPPLYSDAWWELVGWMIDEGKKYGFSVSLSDYTLGIPGQGNFADDMIRENPDIHGGWLRARSYPVTTGAPISIPLPEGFLSAGLVSPSGLSDVTGAISDGAVSLTPAADGTLVLVYYEEEPLSVDPMHPDAGESAIRHFFGRFEEHFPGECGDGLNFFFSDELNFGLADRSFRNTLPKLWDGRLAEEFRKRKGYDLIPLLAGLFCDIGDITPKVRLDYNDVVVTLENENYFSKVFDWHEKRGMIYGCDHGGRGTDLTEFGDYFRTQKYNQGPGCDQPMMNANIVKNKVASSIAHLYERPRVWLEGYHSSGWGVSSADMADVTARNFVMGQNLLSLHGCYYTTHGGWWEWAPPCNCFRMPYWKHFSEFTHATLRLGYLLSQGVHVCDAAVVYPVAAAEGGAPEEGKLAADTAFELMERLYRSGIDADFIDFESIVRAKIEGGALCVAGERYRVVILPAMPVVRFSMLEKLHAFSRAGGTVLAVGELPCASDRAGRCDPVLDGMVRDMFADGKNVIPSMEKAVPSVAAEIGTLDFSSAYGGDRFLHHRKIGGRDVYMVYGVPKGTVCRFRAQGTAALWNPYDGKRYSLASVPHGDGTTSLALPLEASEYELIVFDRTGKAPDASYRGYGLPARSLTLSGDYRFRLLPTLDNRMGDFRLPASDSFVGARLCTAVYAEGDCEQAPDASVFHGKVRFSFGKIMKCEGPFETEEALVRSFERARAGDTAGFSDYEISWRYGRWGQPGAQGYHGLKELVTDEFLYFCEPKDAPASARGRVFAGAVDVPRSGTYFILSGGAAPRFAAVDGRVLPADTHGIRLEQGIHRVALAYDGEGSAYFMLSRRETPSAEPAGELSMRWTHDRSALRYDYYGGARAPKFGFFRFQSPPGLRRMRIPAFADSLAVFADGRPIRADRTGRVLPSGAEEWLCEPDAVLARPAQILIRAALRPEHYGGAVIDEFIDFDCAEGLFPAGDWSLCDGLECYSGGAAYMRTLPPVEADGGSVVLDLGAVRSSAEVFVNGKSAGVRIAPPYRFELTDLLEDGENELRIEVYNTLANFYLAVPTRYGGSPVSGLLTEPVLRICPRRP